MLSRPRLAGGRPRARPRESRPRGGARGPGETRRRPPRRPSPPPPRRRTSASTRRAARCGASSGRSLARDWPKAASHLDLRGRTEAQGILLARQLKTVLDRKLWVDLDALSNASEGEANDGQPRDRDLVGSIELPDGNWVRVLLERLPGDQDAPVEGRAQHGAADSRALGCLRRRAPRRACCPSRSSTSASSTSSCGSGSPWSCSCSPRSALAWLLTAPLLRLVRAIARRTGSHIDDVAGEADHRTAPAGARHRGLPGRSLPHLARRAAASRRSRLSPKRSSRSRSPGSSCG